MAVRRTGLLTEDLSHVEFETSEDVEVLTTFDNMKLREYLVRGIYSYGFERPSAIQQRAIKPMIKGRDVIAQAQSGTGKTATFSIAILQSIDGQLRDTQVLCLSPTRELAVQIQKETNNILKSEDNFIGFPIDDDKLAVFEHKKKYLKIELFKEQSKSKEGDKPSDSLSIINQKKQSKSSSK